MATVSPYVGIGPDLVFYKYEEFGDFIDFGDPERSISADDFVSEGARPGFHVTGGLRVRIGHDFSILGEGPLQWAKATLGDDFRPQPGQGRAASRHVGLQRRRRAEHPLLAPARACYDLPLARSESALAI